MTHLNYGSEIRNTGQDPAGSEWEGTSAEWHEDASADTGSSHIIPGRGFLVLCAWCDEGFFAKTKGEAMDMFRKHEDAMSEAANKRVRCEVMDHEGRQCVMYNDHPMHVTEWGTGLDRMRFVWEQDTSPLVIERVRLRMEIDRARTTLWLRASDKQAYDKAVAALAEFDKRHLS